MTKDEIENTLNDLGVMSHPSALRAVRVLVALSAERDTLAAKVAELEGVIAPYAREALRLGLTNPAPCIGDGAVVRPILTRGELRAAMAALKPQPKERNHD
jgi:hypothetical protein